MVHEIGETTRTFFTTMKDQPAVLALIVCNIALLVFIFYALHAAGTFRQQMLDLLAKCAAVH